MYDNDHQLLAVGKLPRAIRKDSNLTISFKVRFDI